MPPISFVVDRREAGKTLAAVLKTRYGLSWSQAKRLVAGQHVRIGQQLETDVAKRLKLGKTVRLETGTVEIKSPNRKAEAKAKPAPGAAPRPAAKNSPTDRKKPGLPSALVAAIEIVYSDDAVVVVNKPAGLTTMRHRDEADEFGAGQRFLTRTLAGVLPGLLGAPDRPVLPVHRIDRDTSGLVVFARTQAAADHLTKQFRKHSVERRYLALTRGTPKPGRIESVLVPDRGDGRRGSTRKTKPADGKRAVTHFKVLEELGDFAAVESRLETGRTHQVRIHLGEAGQPLCGERVYDRAVNSRPLPDGSGAERPMLHASKLGFIHPETGAAVAWEVKPPSDFAALWAQLREGVRRVTTPAVELPRRWEWLLRGFRRYTVRYVRKHFHAVRVSNAGPAFPPADEPVLVVLNHPSWWDPLIGLVLSSVFADRDQFAAMDAVAVGRYGFFKRLGFIGVDTTSLRGAANFLRAGEAVLSQPGRVFWVTAQGRFADVRQRPLNLRSGVGHLAARLGRGVIVPLALEYAFWDERTPEALARFGHPIRITDHPGLDGKAWTRLIEDALTRTLDALNAEAVTRDPARFTAVVAGKTGVGGVYDVWGRAKAWVRGERFDPSHAAATKERP